MLHEIEANLRSAPPRPRDGSARAARAAVAPACARAEFPRALAWGEHAVAALRRYLDDRGLLDWRIFGSNDLGIWDVDEHLARLAPRGGGGDGSGAAWDPMSPSVLGDNDPPTLVWGWDNKPGPTVAAPGFLHLRKQKVVLARWPVLDEENSWSLIWLCAAPAADRVRRLRRAIEGLRREQSKAAWQVVRGSGDGPRVTRGQPGAWDALLLAPAVRARLDAEVVRFFAPDAAAMYGALGVPYRRGVLLHGPPGNGKTSIIRALGGLLPDVAGLILRPDEHFGSNALETLVNRWRRMGPCILVIEDLDWMLEHVDLSLFLNLLDGIDPSAATGGLLLIATTNHPEKLDPAVNNRPGRFDAVIELPPPDRDLRLAFLRRHLADLDAAALATAADRTAGLSFAHLGELLRLSGFVALRDGRSHRTADDLRRAVDLTVAGNEAAARGFPSAPEVPFGLHALHARR